MIYNDIMVDLETLGLNNNAVIIAIGAVAFNAEGLCKDTFYKVVDPTSCTDIGMQIDASTVMWWMRQSDAARKAFDRPGARIEDALNHFAEWIHVAGPEPLVWGNGATFDNIILGNAYASAGIKKPWGNFNDRCYRTLKGMYPTIKAAKTGTAHNALDDARNQALHAIALLKHAKVW